MLGHMSVGPARRRQGEAGMGLNGDSSAAPEDLVVAVLMDST
jgi:hypothetical protein